MCFFCNGGTEQEFDDMVQTVIDVYGYFIQSVEESDEPGWSYTVGLQEGLGHPELICLDVKASFQAELLSGIGGMIVDGSPPTPFELRAADLELLPVHPNHLADGLVATWVDRYRRLPVAGDFLQVLPGPSYFCGCHPEQLRRLDGPTITLSARGPNRQQRRAARRRR